MPVMGGKVQVWGTKIGGATHSGDRARTGGGHLESLVSRISSGDTLSRSSWKCRGLRTHQRVTVSDLEDLLVKKL